jgi:hypothetical protein
MEDAKLIEEMFRARFEDYEMPELGGERALSAMSEGQRATHVAGIADALRNAPLALEFSWVKRRLYNTLAVHETDPAIRQGLRLALLAIMDFEKRLKHVASRAKEAPIQPLSTKL